MKFNSYQFFVLFTICFAQIEAKAVTPNIKVQDFIYDYCMDCHDTDTQKGDFDIEILKNINQDNSAYWMQIWEQIALEDMPPRDKKNQPSILERKEIADWIINGLENTLEKEGGFNDHHKPEKGNHIHHELLFGENNLKFDPPSTPARIWRIDPQTYLVRLNELMNRTPRFNPKRPGLYTRGDGIPLPSVPGNYGQLKINPASDHVYGIYDGTNWSAVLPAVIPAFNLKHKHGIQDYAAFYSIQEAEIGQIIQNARLILNYLIEGPPKSRLKSDKEIDSILNPQKGNKRKKKPASKLKSPYYSKDYQRKKSPIPDLLKSPYTKAKAKSVITYIFEHIVCRKPKNEEVIAYTENIEKTLESLEGKEAVLVALTPLFLHPEALYNIEMVKNGKADKFGRVALAGHELMMSLNGALSYLPPDKKLQHSLASGRLKTKSDVKRELSRLLNDKSFRKPKILRFIQEYFDYTHGAKICKDPDERAKSGSQHVDRDYIWSVLRMRAHTDRIVELILEKDENVFYELLTTNKAIIADNEDLPKVKRYVNHNNYGNLSWAEIDSKYTKEIKFENKSGTKSPNVINIPSGGNIIYVREHFSNTIMTKTQGKRRLVEMPKYQRMGILTDPSWLISHSDAMDNHAILRGKWVLEHLLGGGVPEVPITVDAVLPDDRTKTLRERMAVTRENECWRCHKKMDPLGLPFEKYNQLGLYRTHDLGKKVDSSGEIKYSGDPKIDGPVSDAIEMISRLAKSKKAEQMFVRYAFRFWMGRNEQLNDAPTLKAAYKAYKDNNGSMNALILSLLTSDSFLYRKPLTASTH